MGHQLPLIKLDILNTCSSDFKWIKQNQWIHLSIQVFHFAKRPLAINEQTPYSYQELTGSLNYAAIFSKPNIIFMVSKLFQFNLDPMETHMTEARSVLAYPKSTINYSIVYGDASSTNIHAYTRAWMLVMPSWYCWCISRGPPVKVAGSIVQVPTFDKFLPSAMAFITPWYRSAQSLFLFDLKKLSRLCSIWA